MPTRKLPSDVPAPAPDSGPVLLAIATRKGAFLLRSDAARRRWQLSAPHFLGHIVHHVVLDPRDGRTLLAAARTGHLGPTIFRSSDRGRSWREATSPPKFRPARAREKKHVVDHTFWLTPGHASEPGTWYAGTSPQGLFVSRDAGDTWAPVAGLNDHPEYSKWMGSVENGTPDGPKLHSIVVDPRDARHLYVAMSSGGIHESLDAGRTWRALVDGCAVVEGIDPGPLEHHDPHCLRLCPSDPDRLYHQNHCGVYRLDRPATRWQRIGRKLPKAVGDSGLPMVVHPRDAEQAFVLPMDGSGVWPRTSPGGKPAVFGTRNGGKTWQRLARGLPAANAWLTVKRQAMGIDGHEPVGLYFGTTSGEVWASRDAGRQWVSIARHLPEIYAVEAAALPR